MSDYIVVSRAQHDALVAEAFLKRGFQPDEVAPGVYLCAEAARHGIRPHIALRALFNDHLFGSKTGGCVPGASIEVTTSRFAASETWNANRKFGPSVAYKAVDRAIDLANEFGIGQIAIDDASPFLWTGGYALAAAERGFIANIQATSPLAEVAPQGGTRPAIGSNTHAWSFPTSHALGFPLLVEWTTSEIERCAVETARNTGEALPPNAAIDSQGQLTTEASRFHALLPFAGERGYGLSMINEVLAAFVGGSLPSIRGRLSSNPNEKNTPSLYLQIIHPEALSSHSFANGRDQLSNVQEVLADILKGNPDSPMPGQLEAEFRKRSDESDGLLFTAVELQEFNTLAQAIGQEPLREKE